MKRSTQDYEKDKKYFRRLYDVKNGGQSMKLIVYKGFDEEFLTKVKEKPLVDGTIATKLDVLKFDKKIRKQLDMELLSLEENDEVWVTYSEYTLIKNRVGDAIEEDGLELIIFTNNLYPDY